MPEQKREHITEGLSCWCRPHVLGYGDELVYSDSGTLLDVRPSDPSDEPREGEDDEEGEVA